MNPIARMMKRYIKMPLKYALPLLFIGALVLVSISGCTSPANSSPSPSASSAPTAQQAQVSATPTSTPAPSAAPTSTPAPSATGFVSLTVNSMTTSNQLGSYPLGSTPTPGKTYVVFDVTVTNQNKDNLYLGNPLYFKLTTADGTVYQYSPASYWLNNHLTGVFNTKPGDKVTGQLAFEIPQSAKPTQLTYGDLINGVVTANL
jgi:hypothetical protein